MRFRTFLVGLALAIAPIPCAWGQFTDFAARSVIDLGSLTPGYSTAQFVSDSGMIVAGASNGIHGSFESDFGYRWTACDGAMYDFGLPPGFYSSGVIAMSRDGSAIFGSAQEDKYLRTFIFTQEHGVQISDSSMYFVGISASGTPFGTTAAAVAPATAAPFRLNGNGAPVICSFPTDAHVLRAAAEAISGDGDVIVGSGLHSGENGQPFIFRWSALTGFADLGHSIPGGTADRCTHSNEDGSVIIGVGSIPNAPTTCLFRWSAATGMQTIQPPAGGNPLIPEFLSANGQVFAGHYNAGVPQHPVAFRWSTTSGTQSITMPSNGTLISIKGMSTDGSIIVGNYELAGQARAFRWTPTSGTEDIGYIPPVPGYAPNAFIYAASADCSILVGHSDGMSFAWTIDHGVEWLPTYLARNGVDTTGWWLSYPYAISPDGSSIAGAGFAPNAKDSHAFLVRTFLDKDGDAIPDDWEVNGVPYFDVNCNEHRYILDTNGDYVSDASPLRKDIFVEVDAMVGLSPNPDAIADVVHAFDIAPVPAPAGLSGGLPGISLHVVIDDQDVQLHNYIISATIPNSTFLGFRSDKDAYFSSNGALNYGFGTDAERDLPDWAHRADAKAQVYRYCIFGNAQVNQQRPGSSGPSGATEGTPSNNFMVTLGAYPPQYKTRNWQAGSFMHELGHSLGLKHGGSDDINYKPNYYSVMNYMWQTPVFRLSPTFQLRYSEEVNPSLNEYELDEQTGIQVLFPTTGMYILAKVGGTPARVPLVSGAPIDWNGDGDTNDFWLLGDINNFIPPPQTDPSTVGFQVLTCQNDWLALKYGFRDSHAFTSATPGISTDTEFDLELVELLNSVPDPCPADIGVQGGIPGHDGILNNNDTIVFYQWFLSGDMRADFGIQGGLPGHDGVLDNNDLAAYFNLFVAGCP